MKQTRGVFLSLVSRMVLAMDLISVGIMEHQALGSKFLMCAKQSASACIQLLSGKGTCEQERAYVRLNMIDVVQAATRLG